jgi:hypothetical protein
MVIFGERLHIESVGIMNVDKFNYYKRCKNIHSVHQTTIPGLGSYNKSHHKIQFSLALAS